MNDEKAKKMYSTPILEKRCMFCFVRRKLRCDGIRLPAIRSVYDFSEQFEKHKDCDDLRMYIDESGDMHIDISYPYVINHETPKNLYSKEGASWWVDHLLKKPWFDWHDAKMFLRKVYDHAGLQGKDVRVELA